MIKLIQISRPFSLFRRFRVRQLVHRLEERLRGRWDRRAGRRKGRRHIHHGRQPFPRNVRRLVANKFHDKFDDKYSRDGIQKILNPHTALREL